MTGAGRALLLAVIAAAPAAARDAGHAGAVAAASARPGSYRITGDRALEPESVSSDGKHTYISWPANASIPAIYTVDSSGNEAPANGMMGTDDVYVVTGVPQLLVFRIDRASARAERIAAGRSR